jgi:DNA segregation ATPase FtsK/SpoIIIE-like protein
MDEFANLADALPTNERRELWRGARMIAAQGRKAGVHLALALQDPTHKSLDLRIRRNYLPLSFRVKDGDASRVILGAGGAEQLSPRQFLTVMDQP